MELTGKAGRFSVKPLGSQGLVACSSSRKRSVSRHPATPSVDKGQTKAYIFDMKYLNWNPQKNEILKKERGISFEEIAYLIESGQIIGIEENPSRPNQKIYIMKIENDAVVVPYVENENEIFQKTAFPSRKHSKRHGLKGE